MRSARAVLFLLGGLVGSEAAAQDDLRDLAVSYAKAYDCETSIDLIEILAQERLGQGPEAVAALVESLVAAGEAQDPGEEGWLALTPPLCEPSVDYASSGAASWIEEFLYTAEGCRMNRAELERAVAAEGVPDGGFERAMAGLLASGVVVEEEDSVAHPLACAVVPVPTDPVARVEGYGDPGVRGLVALAAMAGDCRLPQDGRDELVGAVGWKLLTQVGISEPVPPEAWAAARAAVERVLDNPGPAYEIDPATGDLVMIACTP